MTMSGQVPADAPSLRWSQRVPAALALLAARILARRSPRDIRAVLRTLHRRTQPATYEQAKEAQDVVSSADGPYEGQASLQRCLATTLLCGLRGLSTIVCIGIREATSMGAHVWVEAEGVPVGEDYTFDYKVLYTLP